MAFKSRSRGGARRRTGRVRSSARRRSGGVRRGSQRTGSHTLRIVVDHANLQQPLPPGVMPDNSTPRQRQF